MSNLGIDVRERAAEAYIDQDQRPMSPIDWNSSGEVQLCAAAMIAFIGLEAVEGTETSQMFLTELTAFRDKAVVISAFRQLGWSEHAAVEMFRANDAVPAHRRGECVGDVIRNAAL